MTAAWIRALSRVTGRNMLSIEKRGYLLAVDVTVAHMGAPAAVSIGLYKAPRGKPSPTPRDRVFINRSDLPAVIAALRRAKAVIDSPVPMAEDESPSPLTGAGS